MGRAAIVGNMEKTREVLLSICNLFNVPVFFENRFSPQGAIQVTHTSPPEMEIFLRTDLTLGEELVALAHEVGHLIDFSAAPFSPQERVSWTANPCVLKREERAWEIAHRLLQQSGNLGATITELSRAKQQGIRSYMEAAKCSAENTSG